MISVEDRFMIHELISLHGHLSDDGKLAEFGQVFSSDVKYDLEDFGLGVLQGIPAIRDSALAMGNANPVGHHVTNIILSESQDEHIVNARSKGIGIKADGSCGSVIYEDVLKKQHGQWRITYRKVIVRRLPLGGKL